MKREEKSAKRRASAKHLASFALLTDRGTRRQTWRLQISDPDRHRTPALSDFGTSHQMESEL